ncbi:hypothetical protein R1flu_026732 [Riccia fluitans]|uniref:LAGLIDADG homing endonuclease n=1 Tax=Riccia fluitans TaxID=41844 RepID=A0ABD1XHD8_9MARC
MGLFGFLGQGPLPSDRFYPVLNFNECIPYPSGSNTFLYKLGPAERQYERFNTYLGQTKVINALRRLISLFWYERSNAYLGQTKVINALRRLISLFSPKLTQVESFRWIVAMTGGLNCGTILEVAEPMTTQFRSSNRRK